MTESEFTQELNKINIFPTKEQLENLEKYYLLLIEWNEKMNLTGITEKKEVYLKHFYDSATLNISHDLNNLSLCDVGSGAGFPGLVLKILFPSLKVTLVDSLNKRITFLNYVINTLKLENIETISTRAEEYAIKNREKFDIVTARAVAPLSILLEYTTPLSKVNGYIIPMKADISNEESSIPRISKELKIELIQKKEFLLPFENSKRTLLKFRKTLKTPIIFPRKYSDIKKRPL